MLTTDVRFEGWTIESWTRFLSLWKPRAEPARELIRPRGGVFVVHDGQRVRKVLHGRTGRIDPEVEFPFALSELVERFEGSWGVSIEMGVLEDIMEDFGAQLARDDDLLTQSLKLLGCFRAQMLRPGTSTVAEGARLELWPRRLAGVPVPSDGVVRRALDSLCADGHAILLGLFKDGDLWTALCMRRRGDAFDVIAGPEDMRLALGLLSGDFRRDYVHLSRVCEEMYAPLSFGCFADVDTFRALQVDPEPGAWTRAALVRDVVFSPVPAAVGLALGFDGARLAVDNLRIVTERIDRFGLIDGALRLARQQVGRILEEQDVAATLGFDPLAVLRALLRR